MEENILNEEELLQEVELLLSKRQFTKIKEILSQLNPTDVASILSQIEMAHLAYIFRILPKEFASEVFVDMDSDTQEHLIKSFTDRELKEVLDELFVDDTVDIIEEMPANVVKRILKNSQPDARKAINEILNYPKDSVGSVMTIEFVDLKKDMTVADAFERIRKTGYDKETIYTCYVVDKNRKLEGLVTVRTLLLADSSAKISDIMETNVIFANTLEDKEAIAIKFDKYDFMAIPVVDNEDRLVGIVTFDDAMEVIIEESTEDFSKMAAINPTTESYFKTSVWTHSKNRILWLLFLMLSATVTGMIIQEYETAFKTVPILVSFIPMLMGTGGNCGSQSSTMVIRGLALDEIKSKDLLKAIFKEFRIALVVGFLLSVVNAIRIIIMYNKSQDINAYILALVLGITLVLVVVLAKVIGCILPIVAKKCKLDPAIMAAPIITTILDTCSVLIFFNIANVFMCQIIK
ncbi:MAG: magnesium transporter [Ruminococcaceae bacterium]|nr:magnesium transporter [Oscillospiraceae bacterium]